MMKQQTIKKTASVKGFGLHTGAEVSLSIHPAAADHGIKFKRIDLEENPVVAASLSKVASTQRSTRLKAGEASVATVEHILSALYGMQIDNALIELDGPEIPILDGSAAPFVEMIQEAGIEEQEADRDVFVIEEPIHLKDEASGSELIVLPSDKLEITTMIDFNTEVLGKQYAQLENLADYADAIAPCRTFVFLKELSYLADQDLIKGGSLDNAIVIAERAYAQEELASIAQKIGKPAVEVSQSGILNTLELQFENEPARHKLLDVIGDFSLLGVAIQGKIIAKKPGHSSNVEFAKELKMMYLRQRKLKGKPKYDPDQEPIYNTVDIAKWLPHRYPFLLIDKIIELSDNQVVGVKNITFNEAFFQGHFPNNPVFPGVLQIEAMAQTGGILALSKVEDPGNWDTYFLKIDNAKFKHKVVPGDTILFKMELMAPIRRGICQMIATAYVGNKIVSEAELTAQIVKRT